MARKRGYSSGSGDKPAWLVEREGHDRNPAEEAARNRGHSGAATDAPTGTVTSNSAGLRIVSPDERTVRQKTLEQLMAVVPSMGDDSESGANGLGSAYDAPSSYPQSGARARARASSGSRRSAMRTREPATQDAGAGRGGGGSDSGRTAAPHYSGIPGWLYAAGAAAALLISGYLTGAVAGAFPPLDEIFRRSPPPVTRPVTTGTPSGQATLVVSKYHLKALEEIAKISKQDSVLAELLRSSEQVKALGGATEFDFLEIQKIRSYLENGTTLSSYVDINRDGTKTYVVVLSNRGQDSAASILDEVTTKAPLLVDILGIKYNRPLLIVDQDKDLKTGGTASDSLINISDKSGYAIPHEFTHLLYDDTLPAGKRGTPVWFEEGVAGVSASYIRGGKEVIISSYPALEDLAKQYCYKVPLITAKDEDQCSPMHALGRKLVTQYMILVGEDTFWKAIRDVYNEKMAGTLPSTGLLNMDMVNPTQETMNKLRKQHETLQTVLAKYVPQDKLTEFNELYKSAVYGQ